jgi:hypothetical protein
LKLTNSSRNKEAFFGKSIDRLAGTDELAKQIKEGENRGGNTQKLGAKAERFQKHP